MADNVPAEKLETDLSPKDLEKVQQFAAEGLPGLAKLGETDFTRMAEMYMNGSTYHQISSTLNIPRNLIMYLSHTYSWFPARQEYLHELQEKIKSRVINSKLASQDFMLLLIQAYQKKIGAQLRRYLATDDSATTNDINLKEIDKLLKVIDMLQDLSTEGKSAPKTPAVGLNVGDGVTIERSGDNKVIITPSVNNQLGSMLKKFANDRRAEQNKNAKPHDINNDQTKEEPNNEE